MNVLNRAILVLTTLLLLSVSLIAQDANPIEKKNKDLPLDPERLVEFTTQEGTWMSVDVSPDGSTIAFDMLGDIYTIPRNGGKATKLTAGMAFDSHPKYSPDGNRMLFISDRSGSQNAWYLDLQTMEETQVTKATNEEMVNGAWSPDGKYMVISRGRRNFKLHLHHVDGGSGVKIVDEPGNLKAIDPTFSADGRYVYYSRRFGSWNYNAQFPQYSIGVFDRETADESVLVSRYGSAFTPEVSPDGNWMVYGTRFETETGLILRNMKTGSEEWLAYPVQHDDQESQASLGVLPAMSFTPDSEQLVVFYGGKLWSIGIADRSVTEIPFEVDVSLELGPDMQFKYPVSDEPMQLATQIRNAVPSPDGSKLAFTALNRMYVMDFPNGTPKRITNEDVIEAHPAWSPDGKSLVYVTWDEKDGGHLWRFEPDARRARPQKLTSAPAFYAQPAWSYQSDRIVFLTGTTYDFVSSGIGGSFGAAADSIAWIPAEGGAVTVIDSRKGRTFPHFVKRNDRIHMTSGDGELVSMRWDGTDARKHVQITGIRTFGTSDPVSPSEAGVLYMAPEGDQVLAQVNNEIYTATVPQTGEMVKISVASPDGAAFPARKLTIIGGEFPRWSDDAGSVHWSLGKGHFIYDLSAAKAFDDSVKAAENKEEDSSEDDENGDKEEKSEEPKEYQAEEYRIEVAFMQDIPEGVILLSNAKVITMKGDEIFDKGDILIRNNRIAEVGEAGTITAPDGAEVRDLSGKTVVPGYVDTHAHLRSTRVLHKPQEWSYAANLAYGVTTTRDPQTGTTDVLTYGDKVRAGMMVGPRIYSTGPGVGFWGYKLKSLEHTREVLRQYSEYFDTKTIKMYRVGNREMRQWIIMASKEQKLMPTTEGSLNIRLNVTQMIDGYPGHEHNIPIYPIYKDLVTAIAESKMAVTQTMLVAYGGPWGEEYYYSRENPYDDPKLGRFTPWDELASKTRRRGFWARDDEQIFPRHAEKARQILDAGGLIGIGSHGQLQGLGYHWELWSVAAGGLSNHDALRAATIVGAEALGLDGDLGSIEAGKLADLVILTADPLDDLRNSNTVEQVMINGRLHDASTLDQLYPLKKPFDGIIWKQSLPEAGTLPGIK